MADEIALFFRHQNSVIAAPLYGDIYFMDGARDGPPAGRCGPKLFRPKKCLFHHLQDFRS
jgi:hypothetical protein